METNKSRVRFTPDVLHVREAQEGQPESRVIEGRAIVFNSPCTLYEGKYEILTETISDSCITQAFLKKQDVMLNLLHERDNTLGRCNKGKGSMSLELREDGLYFSAEMPECDLGDRALALVKNGTYIGCSFEFYAKDYTTEESVDMDGRKHMHVTHTAFEKLTALTIALEPAYDQTTVSVREKMQEDECKKQADEDAEARRQAEEDACKGYHEPTPEQVREMEELQKGKMQTLNSVLRVVIDDGDALL